VIVFKPTFAIKALSSNEMAIRIAKELLTSDEHAIMFCYMYSACFVICLICCLSVLFTLSFY